MRRSSPDQAASAAHQTTAPAMPDRRKPGTARATPSARVNGADRTWHKPHTSNRSCTWRRPRRWRGRRAGRGRGTGQHHPGDRRLSVTVFFLPDSCVDGIIADEEQVAVHGTLAAETMVAEFARRAAPWRPGVRVRRLAGARHGRDSRPASLGAPGRPPARRGGAGAVAGRGPSPGATARSRRAKLFASARLGHVTSVRLPHRVLGVDDHPSPAPRPG